MSDQQESVLSEAYKLLKSGDIEKASTILKEGLVYNLEDEELIFALHCCNFWIDCIRRMENLKDSYEKGESLLLEWKSFQLVIKREKKTFELALYAIKTGVFTLALECYKEIEEPKQSSQKGIVLRKLGLCCKELGEFDLAKTYLMQANEVSPGSALILAELADCYALCGEERQSKVLFREAFFLDAASIDLSFLDSELIRCLIQKVQEKKYTGAVLLEWIPVYGQLFGVFNVKRKLRPQEVGKLRQEIYAKENEMKDPSCDSKLITPRLINLYFWIIDYYVLAENENSRINDILIRIKILDSEIYNLYVK